MGFVDLPPEVLHLILAIIAHDVKSLSSLCAVDKKIYAISSPLLYQSVTLASDRAVSAFCRPHMVGTHQPTYSLSLTKLHVGSHWRVRLDECEFRLFRDLAPDLRCALENLENLKYLSLSISVRALQALLINLVVPFQLESFVHSGRLSTNLLRFLEGQPLITYLGWHEVAFQTDAELFCQSMKNNSNLLPKLKAFDGPLHFITGLLPLRPISNITIVETWFPSHVERFIEVLQRATVPITRMSICGEENGWSTWIGIASMVHSTNLASTLKQLRIVETPRTPMAEHEFLTRSIGNLFSLVLANSSFGVLERFEMFNTRTRWQLSASTIESWLRREGMCELSHWRAYAPSLRTVILYGNVIF
ncbi:hypothetical protein B0J17DRAFT_683411 [Rhizoctonia solani]|nr:hypothetical protein B0J17DRAFT_683411 [Rhizoctonia solani]